MFMKSLLTVAVAGGMLFAASAANATVATYTTATAYSNFAGGGTIGIQDNVDWGQFSLAQGNMTVNNSSVSNGSTMNTVNSEHVTATNGTSTGFTVFTNGQTSGLPATRWDGDFANATNVLSTQASSITLTFAGAITGFGIHAQTTLSGNFGFQIQAFNAAGNLLGTATNSGTSHGRANSSFAGSAPFAGITSTAGDISYVTITATSNNTSGFAIDTSLIYHFANNQTSGGTGTQTPEPGTIALLGAGLVALGAVRRRRNRA